MSTTGKPMADLTADERLDEIRTVAKNIQRQVIAPDCTDVERADMVHGSAGLILDLCDRGRRGEAGAPQQKEEKEDLARMDTMGGSTDSRTAPTNEAVRPISEAMGLSENIIVVPRKTNP